VFPVPDEEPGQGALVDPTIAFGKEGGGQVQEIFVVLQHLFSLWNLLRSFKLKILPE
jgi:hypothetical protein